MLTGSARKIKDSAAEFHNLFLNWDRLNDQGFTTATCIIRTRSQSDQTRSQLDQILLSAAEGLSSPLAPAGGADELQTDCCKLQEIVHKMSGLVVKMEQLLESHRGILDLDQFHFGSKGRTQPLFQTWTSSDFESLARSLWTWFRSELDLKRLVLQELAHCEDPDLGLVYLSLWVHEPQIPVQTRLVLEGLLLETGHRDL